MTDAAGHFVVQGLPPGEYVAGVNFADTVSYVPYPRTLFVDTAGEPEIVQLAAGQHVGLPRLRLGPALEKTRTRVRLVDEAGQPLPRRQVILRDVTNPGIPEPLQLVRAGETDGAGFVEFDLRETRSYAIQAARERSSAAVRTRVFSAADGTALTLVLPPAAK
jgi:hypothetical protein